MILGIIIALGIIWLWLIYEWRRSPSYEDVWGDDLFTLDDDDEEYNPLRYEDDNEDLKYIIKQGKLYNRFTRNLSKIKEDKFYII